RVDHAVTGIDRSALDDRQQIALHALARNIRAAPAAGCAAGDLIEFIEENDPGIFRPLDGLSRNVFHIDEVFLFIADEQYFGVDDLHLPTDGFCRKHISEHIAEIDAHLFHSLTADKIDHRV